MNKKDLEYILFILLSSLTGIAGLVAMLFMAYILNYKKYWKIIISFIIGWSINVILISNLTYIEILIYDFIAGTISIILAYIIHKDRFVIEPIDLTLENKNG